MTKLKTAFILTLMLLSPALYSQNITDLIEPFYITAGETDSLLMSDMFFSNSYDLKFEANQFIKTTYNEASRTAYLTCSKNFEGMTILKFKLAGKEYSFPVAANIPQTIHFSYKPPVNSKQVNLFGNFNNWNRQELVMSDNDKDGRYEIDVNIEPGRYEYKYFVDGQELVDPENKEQVPNGMGSFNNLLNVTPKFTETAYLHLISSSSDKNTITVKTWFEKGKSPASINLDNVVALANNFQISPEKIKIDGQFITFSVDKNLLQGEDVLRFAVTHKGQNSNILSVFLKNGKAYTTKDFTWRQAIVYSLMVDRFKDGDPKNTNPVKHPDLKPQANYMGGDIQGILDKVNDGYFDKLGINTIWITPVVDNTPNAFQEYPAPHRYYTGYHGYWPVSVEGIEERFGDLPLLKKFTSTAHKKNYKILVDFVGHHVHIEHPFWTQHRDWFGTLDLPDGRKNLRLWDEYRLTTWFEPYMPSFDYTRSKEALELMTDNGIWWIKEAGMDGFRHDAVKHVPNFFWRLLTEKIRKQIEIPEHRKVYQVGESYGGFDLIKYYVSNGQLSAQFNFNLFDTAVPVFSDSTTSFAALNNQMQKSFAVYGVNNLMGNIIGNHDRPRFMAYADGDLDGGVNPSELAWNNPPTVDKLSSYEKLKMHFAYLLSIPGVPVIYYGDEFGMTGANDPDNRRMMRFGNELNSNEKKTLAEVTKLVALRKNHTALNYGDFLTLTADNNCYIYLRSDLNERVLVLLNKSSIPVTKTVELPAVYNTKKLVNLLSKKELRIAGNSVEITIPAYGYLFFNLK